MIGPGCKPDPSPSAAAAPSPDVVRPPTPPLPAPGPRTVRQSPERMREHFKAGVLVRDALISGDLALAQWNATWLAEREPEPDIVSWSPSINELRVRARAIAEAPDLAAAATATAELAVECGRCHQVNGASPRLVEDDPRIPASGRRPHMLEHQWAAQRLWDGLIGASAATWNRGAAGLATAPLGQDEILDNATATPRIAALAADVHALGAEGRRAQTWSERATVYGRLLATCATCHAALAPR